MQTDTMLLSRYTRKDVLRILRLPARHLTAWERQGLIQPLHTAKSDSNAAYSFQHLSQIRALRELHALRISARSIRASCDAMKHELGMSDPLLESTAVRNGTGLAFRHRGALLNPLTKQLAFDFDTGADRQLTLANPVTQPPSQQDGKNSQELQEKFVRAVQLEENPKTLAEAARLYESILATRPDHAPSCINLGTIFYNQREFARAEAMYRRATESDPHYALAFFDLGNVLDEGQNLAGAIAAYSRAIELIPTYADAHYNLALAYERKGERRRALRHWMTYVRLDPIGPWAAHARTQARKILALERLSIVSRSDRRAVFEANAAS
jgi:tetratricopeptide (TPR) repeat protein